MSISNTVSKAGPWTADGTQTVFPFLFVPLSADYVEVWVDDRIVTNALGTVYTVSVNPDGAGGSVTFLTAPTEGSRVALIRNVPASQLIDLQNNTAFLPEILEAGLDKLTILAQQYGEKAERSVVMPPTASTVTPWAYIQEKLDEMGEAVEDAEDAATAAVSASTASQAAAQQAQQAASSIVNKALVPDWGSVSESVPVGSTVTVEYPAFLVAHMPTRNGQEVTTANRPHAEIHVNYSQVLYYAEAACVSDVTFNGSSITVLYSWVGSGGTYIIPVSTGDRIFIEEGGDGTSSGFGSYLLYPAKSITIS